MILKKLLQVTLLGSALFSLPATVQAQGTRLLRQPTVSEGHVAFVYANDLWIADRKGGSADLGYARRLTSNEGAETNPHFSPDGKWIAFTGQYDGNTDVYLIPVEGGQPKRLTWHPGSDDVTGWTPDGKSVLFISARHGHPTANARFYQVSVDQGMPQALKIPQAANGELSEDGLFAAYQPISFWDPEWRNYRGGQAQPIWIVDLKDYSLKQTPQANKERHTSPVWMDGIVYFLSERDYANNIWSYNPQTEEVKQHTFHKQFDTKNLDAGAGMLVYEQGGYLHLLNPKTNETKQLTIEVRGDFDWARPRWADVSPTQLTHASLSPGGKRALFESRGEVFTVPKEEGDWRNITRTPGAADRYPTWSPDGKKIAWFSDATGEYQLMIGDQEGLTKPRSIAIPNPTFFFRPEWSPNNKYIAFTDTDYNLWYVEVANGKINKADTEGYAHPDRTLNPVWSPDSKWIAYTRLLENQFKAVKVHNVETNQTLQLTDKMADALSPVWDESGKYLYFLASTNFGLNTGWLDMSSYDHPVTRSLYMIVLSKDTPSPLLPRSDEELAQNNEEDEEDQELQDGNSKKKEKEVRTKSGQKGEEKVVKPAVQVKIDMEGLSQRIIPVDIPERNYTGLLPGPEEQVFYLEAIQNQQGDNLHRYSLKDAKSTEYLTKVNDAAVSFDRKSLLYRSGSNWSIVSATGSAPKAGDGKLKVADIKVKVEPEAEWKQIFREGWRYQRDFLYVDNVHGAPWDKLYEWYSPWLEHVRHRSELHYMIDILGGEVSVGHSYTSGGDFPDVKRVPIGLLGADYEVDKGYYRISNIYNGEAWNPDLRAPLRAPGLNINKGDYILEVNGVEVKAPENIYKFFEATADRQTVLRINSKPTREGSRLVTVVPIANENGLRRMAWIEGNRRKVDELSGGKLAYVYVPNTGQGGYTYFNRYYFGQQDKKGAVIDERNNGGGSAADYMVDIMGRELHGYFNSKVGEHRPFTTPMSGIWGPKVMIVNEMAGSGGDLLPYLFRKMEIGPIVGTRTWGGLVGTWDTPPFIDGGRMVAPRGGFVDANGEWAVEGEGVAPDIEVMNKPADVIAGRDPQLERAVAEAMELLKTQEVILKPEPAAPNRWHRPEGWEKEAEQPNQ
ncbi:protease [Pontibacter diazotrophicus]|uniref:Tricorn protease homolog n=1 Tax=Pontibacter diazotrophicus TaxID=1400979 RepID=A0A3D8LAA1_9BACT|nr:S41 family peptidase [Pontibacter diazotrophicus]RDV14273.1 protease [Pontibacter diazotrophicus]